MLLVATVKNSTAIFTMPYKRKRASGGSYAKAKRVRTKASMVRGYTRRVGNYGRYMPPAGCGPEQKFFDGTLDITSIAQAGAVLDSINEIPQGVTEITRVGRKAVIKSLAYNYSVIAPETGDTATPAHGSQVRIILFQDKQCNGTTAAVEDILETANYKSYYNLVNSGRFKILMDRTHNINYHTLAAGPTAAKFSQSEHQQHYTFYKKLNVPIEFDATSGAITTIRSNNFGILTISKETSPNLSSKWRLRFTD